MSKTKLLSDGVVCRGSQLIMSLDGSILNSGVLLSSTFLPPYERLRYDANTVILSIVISQVFPCRPIGVWVLGPVSYVLQLLSVLFWIFWVQLKTWRYMYIQNLRQFYHMGISVYWRTSPSIYCIGSWFNSQDGCLCASACGEYHTKGWLLATKIEYSFFISLFNIRMMPVLVVTVH
jgi:hypothetical protein